MSDSGPAESRRVFHQLDVFADTLAAIHRPPAREPLLGGVALGGEIFGAGGDAVGFE